MLGAEDAMKLVTFKRTVYPNSFSKIFGGDLKETLIIITIIAKEAAAGIKGTRAEMK